jgi:hypothetical protein
MVFLQIQLQFLIRGLYSQRKQHHQKLLIALAWSNILTTDDDVFVRNQKIRKLFCIAIEKSMYRSISDEMLNMFASIADFADLVAEPGSLYRDEYKSMTKAASAFL